MEWCHHGVKTFRGGVGLVMTVKGLAKMIYKSLVPGITTTAHKLAPLCTGSLQLNCQRNIIQTIKFHFLIEHPVYSYM